MPEYHGGGERSLGHQVRIEFVPVLSGHPRIVALAVFSLQNTTKNVNAIRLYGGRPRPELL